MSSLEKYTHTKTAFSNMVGAFFPRKMEVLFRLKVHCADIAEKIFNFLTSKSWFSRGYISVIISVRFLNDILRFFRMPSNFPHSSSFEKFVFFDVKHLQISSHPTLQLPSEIPINSTYTSNIYIYIPLRDTQVPLAPPTFLVESIGYRFVNYRP